MILFCLACVFILEIWITFHLITHEWLSCCVLVVHCFMCFRSPFSLPPLLPSPPSSSPHLLSPYLFFHLPLIFVRKTCFVSCRHLAHHRQFVVGLESSLSTISSSSFSLLFLREPFVTDKLLLWTILHFSLLFRKILILLLSSFQKALFLLLVTYLTKERSTAASRSQKKKKLLILYSLVCSTVEAVFCSLPLCLVVF
jgi:hypothetical protein